MIDLDQMPPDWKFAENHAKAVRPGIVENLQSKKGTNIYCQCCLKPVEKQNVPLTSNSKELQFLGFGFPLYYIYLKYSIILVLILICSYSGLSLYWAISVNQSICQHRLLSSSSSQSNMHCTSFLIIFSRIQAQLLGEEIILRIASFVIHLFALIYIRDHIRKTYSYYDERTTSLSDFSLIIKKLPLKDGIQQNIKDFVDQFFQKDWEKFQEEFENEHFKASAEKIKKIVLVPDLKEYYKLESEKHELIEEKRKILIHEQKTQNSVNPQTPATITQLSPLEKVDEKIKEIKLRIQNTKAQFCQKANQDRLHAEMAIVIMNTQMHKSTVVDFAEDGQQKLNKQLLGKYFGDFEGEIEIEEAPEPNEIIWQNLHYSSHQRVVGKIIGSALSILFIAIVTVAFYFILVVKTNTLLHAIESELTPQQLHKSGQYRAAVFIVFLLIFLIVLFNKLVLGTVLHYFTHLEKHQNTSDQEFFFALKYTLGLFFTTALMTLAVEAITYHNFYKHQYGVIEEESIMFFVNAFFIPIFMLVNPFQLKILITRWFKKGKKHFTQSQANHIMSDNPYAMGKEYAQIIETLWFTFLYATLIPLGAFITAIGLCLYYWMSKFNMLRRSSLQHNISGEMALFSLKFLDVTLMMKPIGEIIFDSSIRDGISLESIVLVCVGVVYFLLPMDKILKFFHEQKFRQQEDTYDEVKHTFLQTYQTLHPIMNHEVTNVLKTFQSVSQKKITLTQIDHPEVVDDILLYHRERTMGPMMSIQLNSNNQQKFSTQQQLLDTQKMFTFITPQIDPLSIWFANGINNEQQKVEQKPQTARQ